jgi:hypothetical protein
MPLIDALVADLVWRSIVEYRINSASIIEKINAEVDTPVIRRVIPAGLPSVAETDKDIAGFYIATNFAVTSLGWKNPGVERFCVRSRLMVVDIDCTTTILR